MLLNKSGQWVCLLGNFFYHFPQPYSFMIIHFYTQLVFFCAILLSVHKCLNTAEITSAKRKEWKLFTWKNTEKERKKIEKKSKKKKKKIQVSWGRNVYLGLCVKIIISLFRFFLQFFLLFKWFRIGYSQFTSLFLIFVPCIVFVINFRFVWKVIFQNQLFIVTLFCSFSIISSFTSSHPLLEKPPTVLLHIRYTFFTLLFFF